MSKSKYNGVDPGEILEKYGVDTTRLLLLFSIAPKSHREWNSNRKFVEKYSISLQLMIFLS